MIINFFLIALVWHQSFCFNIFPQPAHEFIKDSSRTSANRSEFGYSVILKQNLIIISAPKDVDNRGESTGKIYRCRINESKKYCFAYDMKRSFEETSEMTEYVHYNDGQMLGAAMDEVNSNQIIACASRHADRIMNKKCCSDGNRMIGKCFLIDVDGSKVKGFYPFKNWAMRYYQFDQAGFSVHVPKGSTEIIYGAPGYTLWSGNIVRQNLKQQNIELMRYKRSNGHLFAYFGYDVKSGYFDGADKSIYYVASMPRINYIGSVHLFKTGKSMQQEGLKIFNGEQYGEFFGYSLLVDDFNNDTFPDLLISAPFHSKNNYDESGVVYIFMNKKGNVGSLIRTEIVKPNSLNGRFGTSMSSIGDINKDGYNDVAISAPFEGNGVVYIYMGSLRGLAERPSQKIEAPSSVTMFGFSISKGVDVDGNLYNDIAVGAPGSDIVFIFKSQPIIRVVASVNFAEKDIMTNTTEFGINICFHYESRTNIKRDIDLLATLQVDMNFRRLSFVRNSIKNLIDLNDLKINEKDDCREIKVFVVPKDIKFMNIFKPMEVKLSFKPEVAQNPREFCETCVVVDPKDSSSITKQIAFNSGCSEKECRTDLKITGKYLDIDDPFILGSSNNITVSFSITNAHENAYITKLFVEVPSQVHFFKIPQHCAFEEAIMICDVNDGRNIKTGETFNETFNIDTTQFQGKAITILAKVTSEGIEKFPDDNKFKLVLNLTEFSNIEQSVTLSNSTMFVYTNSLNDTLSYEYRIFNAGPSSVNLVITMDFPIMFKTTKMRLFECLIGKLKMSVSYNYEDFPVNWEENDSENLLNMCLTKNRNGSITYTGVNDEGEAKRNRRSTETFEPIVMDNDAKNNLMKNITTFIECGNLDENNSEGITKCIRVHFNVQDFKARAEPITINLKFTMIINDMDNAFGNDKIIYVAPNLMLHRKGDEGHENLNITIQQIAHTVIYRLVKNEIPIWIYIISCFIAILLFILITYCLYKRGFFRRKKKEELKQLIRESRRISKRQIDDMLKKLEAKPEAKLD